MQLDMDPPPASASGQTDPARTSLFGVFDGHGGSEVAKYAARHMVRTRALCRCVTHGARCDLPASPGRTFAPRDRLVGRKVSMMAPWITPQSDRGVRRDPCICTPYKRARAVMFRTVITDSRNRGECMELIIAARATRRRSSWRRRRAF